MSHPRPPNPAPAPTQAPAQASAQAVAPVELFFDLVFAFGFSQISHHLAARMTWRGLGETLVLLMCVLTVWVSASWSATLVRAPAARPQVMLLVSMALGLFMNAALEGAFGSRAWAFLGPFVAVEVGRVLWTIRFAPDAAHRAHYRRTLVWLAAGLPLWFAGAAFGPPHRLPLWSLACFLQILGIWTAHPLPRRRLRSQAMPFDAAHFLERCALFLLIGLGETVVSTGLALSQSGFDLWQVLSAICALAGTTAMWGIIYGPGYVASAAHLSRTSDPVRVARSGVNAVILMITGLIATAAANQMLIAVAKGPFDLSPNLLLAAGPVLFVLGHLVFMSDVPGFRRVHHLWGLAVLVAAGAVSVWLPPVGALTLVGTALSLVALADRSRAKPA